MDHDTARPPRARAGTSIYDEPDAPAGTAVAAVAHEINNPITYVLGNLEDLQRLLGALREALDAYRELGAAPSTSGAERVAAAEARLSAAGGPALLDELLGDAREGARRVRDLVRDLVSRRRQAALCLQPVETGELLDAMLRLAEPHFSAPVRIERDYRAGRRVLADRARLEQVLLNLISNAADACAAGRAGSAQICARTRDRDGGVDLEIEDSGPGVPAGVRERLFSPFCTTKGPEAGSGLGLFVSRRIVEEHGGALGFRTSPSGGTIFWVHLQAEEG